MEAAELTRTSLSERMKHKPNQRNEIGHCFTNGWDTKRVYIFVKNDEIGFYLLFFTFSGSYIRIK